jgi:hypothetical protein
MQWHNGPENQKKEPTLFLTAPFVTLTASRRLTNFTNAITLII